MKTDGTPIRQKFFPKHVADASARILHENGIGERRMYVTRNGRLIGLDGGKK